MASENIAFVSGHMDMNLPEFLEHYKETLDNAVQAGHKFVMGSAQGVDALALNYLLESGVPPKDITVYYLNKKEDTRSSFEALGVNIGEHHTNSYSQRDALMTQNSTYDIAYVRSAEESKKLYGEKYDPTKISGTEENLRRRLVNNSFII